MLKKLWLKSTKTHLVSDPKEQIMYTIEKNIPLPERKSREIKYPFADMQVGDSFYAEKGWQTVYNASTYFRKTRKLLNWKFRCAPEGDGCRIWRVK